MLSNILRETFEKQYFNENEEDIDIAFEKWIKKEIDGFSSFLICADKTAPYFTEIEIYCNDAYNNEYGDFKSCKNCGHFYVDHFDEDNDMKPLQICKGHNRCSKFI